MQLTHRDRKEGRELEGGLLEQDGASLLSGVFAYLRVVNARWQRIMEVYYAYVCPLCVRVVQETGVSSSEPTETLKTFR